MAIPLESLLLFSLLPDFWKLFLIVLSCFALLGFPAWIIFYPVNFFLPCLHQLIITLTDFLFLLNSKSKAWRKHKYPKWSVHIPWDLHDKFGDVNRGSRQKTNHMLFLQKHGSITRCFLAWFLLLKNSISFFLITWFLGNKIGGKIVSYIGIKHWWNNDVTDTVLYQREDSWRWLE